MKYNFAVLYLSLKDGPYTLLHKKLNYRRDSARCPSSSIHCPKLDLVFYIVVADSMGLASLDDARSAVLCPITLNDGHRAVQGHSRSPILVPIESPYAT